MTHDISLIIVNYNQAKLTLACLESVLKMKTGDHVLHVLVVDNGSPDELKISKKILNQGVSLLRSDANLGFTGGNNMGIHAALERHNSDFIFLLNNDTIIHENSLLEMLGYAQAHPDAGIISPKIYFYPGDEFYKKQYSKTQKGKVIWFAGGAIDWRNLDTFHKGVDEVDRGHFEMQDQSEFATGCALLIRRETVEKIGLLRKEYFLYYEDVDWSMRAKQFGYDLGFCAKAQVWHHNAGSSGGAGSSVHIYYQTRNRLLFFWRFGNWRVKMRVLRFAFELLLTGERLQRTGVLHFFMQRFGKQPIT